MFVMLWFHTAGTSSVADNTHITVTGVIIVYCVCCQHQTLYTDIVTKILNDDYNLVSYQILANGSNSTIQLYSNKFTPRKMYLKM